MVPLGQFKARDLRPVKVIVISSTCKPKTLISNDYVHQKYVVEGLNMSQIARELFTSRQTTRARLIKIGVELKSNIDQVQKQKHTSYGHRKVNGKTTKHQTEGRVILSINNMRGKGLSLQEIADVLNQMKIPTKKRGKKWTRGIVDNIYDKNA